MRIMTTLDVRLLAQPSLLLLFIIAAPSMAEPVRAALGTVADGYALKVEVNGVDLSLMRGGASQIVQLFAVDHPQKAKADERSLHLFCLKPGKNTLKVQFDRKSADTGSRLRLYLRSAAYSVDIFDFTIADQKGSIDTTFEVFETMPAGYQTKTRWQP
jgi:hypothetical protein